MPQRYQIAVLLVSIVFAAGGCSSGFQSEWKRSELAATPNAGDHLSGRWKGSWKSDKSGHSGGLRCLASRSGEDTYLAKFNATYAGIFSFNYQMGMNADVREDVTYVAGEQDIGKSYGGVYEYEGQADGKTFRLNYRTKNDYGHFSLTRP